MTKTNQSKRPKILKKEYREGDAALRDFEKTMKALFRATKVTKKARISPLFAGTLVERKARFN